MTRFFSLLIGPEIIWLGIYGLMSLILKMSTVPSKSLDNFLDKLFLLLPLASLLIFSLWYFPSVEKNWLLPRVWLACILGSHFVAEKGLSNYSTQGPGVGMGYLVTLLFVFVVLIVGSIFVKMKF